MADTPVDTVFLNGCVDRMRAGDREAADELLRAAGGRLERLARKMLSRFPSVQRFADTGDVLQNAVVRLLRALGQVRPESSRAFFGLAAEQMRRELLDLAKHYRGPATAIGPNDDQSGDAEPAAPDDAADDLDRWAAFHEQVERLPVEEREVVGLLYYHGWTQAQVAELLGVSVRTVQRWWESASVRLRGVVEGRI